MRYTAYGMHFESAIPLPELVSPEPGYAPTDADVSIEFGTISDQLETPPQGRNRIWHSEPDRFVMSVKRIGRFLVESGTNITVDPDQQASEDDLRFVLLGSILGVLLHQRKLLVLHAGAVKTQRGAVLFCGPSGYGKSTLTAALGERGYAVLSDDVTALCCTDDDNPEKPVTALPAFPRLRLWRDSLEQLSLNPDTMARARKGLNKFLAPVLNHSGESCPVFRIYHLGVHNLAGISISEMAGADKVQALLRNTYRADFIPGLGLSDYHFQQITRTAKQLSMRKIIRPLHPFRLDELVDQLIQEWD